jgi:hypothetical protein
MAQIWRFGSFAYWGNFVTEIENVSQFKLLTKRLEGATTSFVVRTIFTIKVIKSIVLGSANNKKYGNTVMILYTSDIDPLSFLF